MGRVLLAHDPVLERAVAIKLLRDDLGLPPEQRHSLIERMRQEARASARVSHPNIVALHDMGEDGGVGLYLVFEYVEGLTLKEKLSRGPLGPEAAARISRELGDALTLAHASGVLHRDIKPENVMLSKTGSKIADFGIARVPDSTLTRDGGLLGTPAYSAPECITSGDFSPGSDQFSLAATLYEGISGRRAFPGDDAVAVATRIATEEPPKIAEVCGLDPHVDTVLARALSKNAKARYASCDDFGRALAEAIETAPRRAMPTLPDQKHVQAEAPVVASRTTRIAVGAAAAGALIAAAGFQVADALKKPSGTTPDTVVSVGTTADADVQPEDTPAPVRKVKRPTAARQRGDGGIAADAGTEPDAGDDADAGAPKSTSDVVGRP
jgi:serine/threonine-protein kinase